MPRPTKPSGTSGCLSGFGRSTRPTNTPMIAADVARCEQVGRASWSAASAWTARPPIGQRPRSLRRDLQRRRLRTHTLSGGPDLLAHPFAMSPRLVIRHLPDVVGQD